MSDHIEAKLLEAIRSLGQPQHKALRILTEAILEIHKDTAAMRRDVELLHNKLQPILRAMNEEGKVQVYSSKFEGNS
ncbi:hypothetical protein [Oceanibium sediminis]|uniref:hypothetical protein n=1 Tax=Oceanibium sediminis TaxID=2026339 RepID=UPI000DD323D4|nr:hypothetical protein [Oceanibium sediminis]